MGIVINDHNKWFTYGYEQQKAGVPRPPSCFQHQYYEDIVEGWDWAARGGTWDGEQGCIPSPESASASVSYDLDGSLQEPGIDDPYKDIKK